MVVVDVVDVVVGAVVVVEAVVVVGAVVVVDEAVVVVGAALSDSPHAPEANATTATIHSHRFMSTLPLLVISQSYQ